MSLTNLYPPCKPPSQHHHLAVCRKGFWIRVSKIVANISSIKNWLFSLRNPQRQGQFVCKCLIQILLLNTVLLLFLLPHSDIRKSRLTFYLCTQPVQWICQDGTHELTSAFNHQEKSAFPTELREHVPIWGQFLLAFW